MWTWNDCTKLTLDCTCVKALLVCVDLRYWINLWLWKAQSLSSFTPSTVSESFYWLAKVSWHLEAERFADLCADVLLFYNNEILIQWSSVTFVEFEPIKWTQARAQMKKVEVTLFCYIDMQQSHITDTSILWNSPPLHHGSTVEVKFSPDLLVSCWLFYVDFSFVNWRDVGQNLESSAGVDMSPKSAKHAVMTLSMSSFCLLTTLLFALWIWNSSWVNNKRHKGQWQGDSPRAQFWRCEILMSTYLAVRKTFLESLSHEKNARNRAFNILHIGYDIMCKPLRRRWWIYYSESLTTKARFSQVASNEHDLVHIIRKYWWSPWLIDSIAQLFVRWLYGKVLVVLHVDTRQAAGTCSCHDLDYGKVQRDVRYTRWWDSIVLAFRHHKLHHILRSLIFQK